MCCEGSKKCSVYGWFPTAEAGPSVFYPVSWESLGSQEGVSTVPAPWVLGTVLSNPFGCFLLEPLVVSFLPHMHRETLCKPLELPLCSLDCKLQLPSSSWIFSAISSTQSPLGSCWALLVRRPAHNPGSELCQLWGLLCWFPALREHYVLLFDVQCHKHILKKYYVGCLFACCRWEGKSVYPVPEWKSPYVFFFFIPRSLRCAILFYLVFLKTLSFATALPLLTIFKVLPELPLFQCLHVCISL